MKILIVGGVAGGASTAARLRRLSEEVQIILFERGPYISYANCGLPYYIGGKIKERNRLLVQTAKAFNDRFRIDVRTDSEVIEIDKTNKRIKVKNGSEIYWENYDKLVLAPGAEPIKPKLPGLEKVEDILFSLRTVPDTDKIMKFLEEKKPQKATVIGAGFIGLEMAENLRLRGLDVTLVEMQAQVMTNLDPDMAAFIHHELRKNGIELALSQRVEGFAENKVLLADKSYLNTDLIIMCIGVRPETTLAQEAGLAIGQSGGISVTENLVTNDPDIYALGDAIEVLNPILNEKEIIPLAGPANKQGRIVANHILGLASSYKGSFGTSIVKIFDLVAGSVGCNEKMLKAKAIPYKTCTIHPLSHAGYYPGGTRLSLKILFTSEGKILGAQAVGTIGVDKRIDIIASCLHFGGTIYDLTQIEQAYAPPFSSAKDPVNMVGFVAENILNGKCQGITWEEFESLKKEDIFLLDVREIKEHEAGHIEGSTLIPLNSLRDRLDEIPRDKKLVIYCQVGLRGYLATRILAQNGFKNIHNLTGGFTSYNAIMADLASRIPRPATPTIASNEPAIASKLEEGQTKN